MITLAAGLTLIAAPSVIPAAVGIAIQPEQYLLCYLLGASEISMAVLSLLGATLHEFKALRAVTLTIITFHISTAAVEIYAYAGGLSSAIWLNVAARVFVAALFAYFGLFNSRHTNK